MNLTLKNCLSIAALITLPMFAQAGEQKWVCQGVGTNPAEAIGDKPGHSVQISNYSCRTEGGLFDGAVKTGTTVWEYDGPNGISVSGYAIDRKGASILMTQVTDNKITVAMSDGRPTGFAGSGSGRLGAASGAWAAAAGKNASWTFKSTGPGQFVIDVSY